MDKHQSKVTIIACLVIAIAIVSFGAMSRNRSTPKSVATPPPVVSKVQASELTTVGSPDGKMSLTMQERREEDKSVYSFLMKDVEKGSQKEIFVKTVPMGITISIPDNTFSSDNGYVFLKEKNGSTVSYLILTSSGDEIVKDVKTLDVSGLFKAKYEDFVITEATGWAGPTLLVINTDKKESGKGPSFWFDVASKSFIRLSTRFD